MAEAAAERFDVIVIGGGPVGAVIALGLADSGQRVALFERQAPQAGALGMDLRAFALSPASQMLLQQVDLWRYLKPTPYASMDVWEERGTKQLHFDAAEVGRDELGWIQGAGPLAVASWERLEQHGQVVLIVGEGELTLTAEAEAVAVGWGRRRLSAALLVAADGAKSVVRAQLGVDLEQRDTGQASLVSVVRTSGEHGNTAWQRFLLDGPLALLPGADPHTAALVWSQSPAAAERRLAMSDAEFCAELTRMSEACIGQITAVDRRLAFPLVQSIVASFNPRQRVLLVGDAARVVHPLAGLGLNLGFEDAAGLLRRARGALDPGAPGLWRTYARHRRARGLTLMRLFSALQAFYGIRQPFAHWLRNFGVDLVNRAAPAKRQLMQEAMGIGPLARRLL